MTLWSTSIAFVIYILVVRQNSFVKTQDEPDKASNSSKTPESEGSDEEGYSKIDNSQLAPDQSPENPPESSVDDSIPQESQDPSLSPDEPSQPSSLASQSDDQQKEEQLETPDLPDSEDKPAEEDTAESGETPESEDKPAEEDTAESGETPESEDKPAEEDTAESGETPESEDKPAEEDTAESGETPESEDQPPEEDTTETLDTSPPVQEQPEPQPQPQVPATPRSPIELDIGTSKSNKKIDRSDSGGIITFVPKGDNVFSSIKERVGKSCSKTDLIIWDPKTVEEYSDKVKVDAREPDKRLTAYLCNGHTKTFVKSGNEWKEFNPFDISPDEPAQFSSLASQSDDQQKEEQLETPDLPDSEDKPAEEDTAESGETPESEDKPAEEDTAESGETPESEDKPAEEDTAESGETPESEDQPPEEDTTETLDTSPPVQEQPEPQPQPQVPATPRSPIELDIGTSKSNKKIDRSDSGGIITFVPKGDNVFSSIKERVGKSCSKTDLIIWDPKTVEEYSDKVKVDAREPDKRLTAYLCNGHTKTFVKSGNEWKEFDLSESSDSQKLEMSSLDVFLDNLIIVTSNEEISTLVNNDTSTYDVEKSNEEMNTLINDTSTYDVEKSNELVFIKFRTGSKCVRLSFQNTDLYKFQPVEDPKYPKSIIFSKRHMGLTVRLSDDFLLAYTYTDDHGFKLSYEGKVVPIEFKNTKNSDQFWDYQREGDKGIYTTKDNRAYNKVDLVSDNTKTLDDLLWYPTFDTEFSHKVIVDGVLWYKKHKNVTIFQINGDILHFTKVGSCQTTWIQNPTLIPLDLKNTKSTKYSCHRDATYRSYTSKLNFQFHSVTKEKTTIWSCPNPYQASKKVEVENYDKPNIRITVHLPNNVKKVYINSNGEWLEQSSLILNIGSIKENPDYSSIKSGDHTIITTKSSNRFVRIIKKKSCCNCCGSDTVIWQPEIPQHYSHKVILDGSKLCSKRKHIVVYQLDGGITHLQKLGKCGGTWVEISKNITLDISQTKGTREFTREVSENKVIFTATYNFQFCKVMNRKDNVWEPSADNFCKKVIVENYKKPEVKVTLVFSDLISSVYVISNQKWVEKGSVSLDIQQLKSEDYEVKDSGSAIKTYDAGDGSYFTDVRSGSENIWTSDDSGTSKKVILKGTENSEQHIAIFLHDQILVLNKPGKGQPWSDITFSRYNLLHFKLFTIDDSGSQQLIPKEECEMQIDGFSVGYKLKPDVKCSEIRYIDDVIWETNKTYPEGLRLVLDENKIYMIIQGKPELLDLKLKRPKILDLSKTQKCTDYNYGLEGEFGVFTSAEHCVFNGLWADSKGKQDIWYPETENEYSTKIKANKSGVKPDYVLVYLRNGDIKHFTKDKNNWTEHPTRIQLDINKKQTTIPYLYQSAGKSCTFTPKHNFKFVEVKEGDLPVWKPPDSNQTFVKVEVKNMDSEDIEVTVHLSDDYKLVFIKRYGEWMSLGSLILDLDTKETIDYSHQFEDNIHTYSPKDNKKFVKIIPKKNERFIWKSKGKEDVCIKVIIRESEKSGHIMAIVFKSSFLLLYKDKKEWTDITETRSTLAKLKLFREKPNSNKKMEFESGNYKLDCIGFSCGFKFADNVKCLELQYDGNRIWTCDPQSPHPTGVYLNFTLNYFYITFQNGEVTNLKKAIVNEQIEIDIRCKTGSPNYQYVEDKAAVTATYTTIIGVAFNSIKEKKGREAYRTVWKPEETSEFIYKILLYGEKMSSLNHAGLYYAGGPIEHFKLVKVGWRHKSWVRKENYLEVDIKGKGTVEYHRLLDKETKVITYTPRFNFKFKLVREGESGIWYQDKLLYSDIVMLKGNSKKEQFLGIVLLDDTFKFYHKPAKGKWTDKTSEKKCLSIIKMFTKDETGLVQLKKPKYQMITSGFSLVYSFKKDVVCDKIDYKGTTIWARNPKDKSPKGISLNLLENSFTLVFDSGKVKLDVPEPKY